VKLAIRLIFSGILLGLLLAFLPLSQLRDAITSLSLKVWLAIVGGFLLGHSIGVYKWNQVLAMGQAQLGARDALACYAAALFANIGLPSIVGFDGVRATLAARLTKRPHAVLWAVMLDRLLDTAVLCALVLVGVQMLPAAQRLPSATRSALWLAVMLVAVVLTVVVFAVTARRLRVPRRLRRQLLRTLAALRAMRRHPGRGVRALFLSVVIQTGFVALNAVIGDALGMHVSIVAWLIAWPLAKVAALLPMGLGGVVARNAALASLLVPFGVPFAVGVAASLLWQSVGIAGGLLGGLVFLVLRTPAAKGVWRPSPAAATSTDGR
jgi:hypothetical protein